MKKYLVFLMCFVFALTMCACSGKDDEPTASSTPEITDEPTAEPTPEITPEPTGIGMTEALPGIWIPELPFSDWEGTHQDSTNSYEMVTFNAYYDPNSDGLYGSVEEMFGAYAMSFAEYGYTVEEVDTDQYSAENSDGIRVFMWYSGNGRAEITIYR